MGLLSYLVRDWNDLDRIRFVVHDVDRLDTLAEVTLTQDL